MSEGRKTQIVLLDDRRLDLFVQPRLLVKELLDLVASHFNLKEKEYFGIAFHDESGHYNWLGLDKRVLENEFPRKSGTLTLYFGIRFFSETIALLRDTATVEAFYLHSKYLIFRGLIECDSDTAFELAAHVLQATYGDYVSEEKVKADLKKLPVLPTSALKEHPSIAFCEERVLSYYQNLTGTSRGLAIVNYMAIIESLPTYGIHYYEVKDKKLIPWYLGLSFKGIGLYDKTDKKTPRKLFTWRQLENLYYRDKKFSIEVHDAKRIVHTLSSFNLFEDAIREPLDHFDQLSDAISHPSTQVSVSRRTFGPSNVNVHAWFSSTPALTKCTWSMAVAQHQFYLERKHSKAHLPTVRSMSEIAAELSHSTVSLSSSATSDLSESSHSIPSLSSSRFDVSEDQPELTRAAQRDMFAALKARKEALEDTLKSRLEALKQLCIREAELTGRMPKELPLAPGESPPQIRRRIGTAFSITQSVLDRNSEDDDVLSRLELEYDLLTKITNAAHRLAKDKSVAKKVRKQRLQSYHKSQNKMKDMEKRVIELKLHLGKVNHYPASMNHHDDLTADTDSLAPTTDSESDAMSPADSPHNALGRKNLSLQLETSMAPPPPPSSSSVSLPEYGSSSLPSHPPGPGTYYQGSEMQRGGYVTSPVYSTRTQYRNQTYPTFSSRGQSEQDSNAKSPLSRQYSGIVISGYGDSRNNLYNINTQQASKYDSSDELKTPTNCDGNDSVFLQDSDPYGHPGYYGSLDRSKRKSNHVSGRYRSLERAMDRGYNGARPQEQQRGHSVTRMNSGSKTVPHRTSDNQYQSAAVSGNDFARRGEFSADNWRHSAAPEPSPRAQQSPSLSVHTDYEPTTPVSGRGSESSDSHEHLYSPRAYESKFIFSDHSYNSADSVPPHEQRNNSHRVHHQRHRRHHNHRHTNHHQTANTSTIQVDSQQSIEPQTSTLVTVAQHSPHVEVSKPYETSDYYKYSERLRRQRVIEQYKHYLIGSDQESLSSSMSQYSSDSESTHPSSPFYHVGSPAYRGMSPSVSSTHSSHTPSSTQGTPVHVVVNRSSPISYQNVQIKSERRQSQTATSSHIHHMYHQRYQNEGHMQVVNHAQYTPPQPMTCEPVLPDTPYRTAPAKHSSLLPHEHGGRSPPNQANTEKNRHRSPLRPAPSREACSSPSRPTSAQVQELMARAASQSPARQIQQSSSSTEINTSHGHSMKSPDSSFTFDAGESLAEAFSEEMLAWYDDQDGVRKSATLV